MKGCEKVTQDTQKHCETYDAQCKSVLHVTQSSAEKVLEFIRKEVEKKGFVISDFIVQSRLEEKEL